MYVLLTVPAMFGLHDERTVLPEGVKEIERTLVMHDNAGEQYNLQDSASSPGIRHLLHSSAILFLFDPTADPGFRRQYADAQDSQFRDAQYVFEQARIITNAFETFLRHNHNAETKYTRPVIVLFSKADTLADELEEVLNTEPFVLNERHEYILDINYLLKVSYSVRELIKGYSPVITSSIESRAKDVIYIPVSALGHSPIEVGTNSRGEVLMGVDLARLKPKWVDVPLLYVLYKLGYLAGDKKCESVPAAEPQILERLPDSVSFVHPATNRRDSLPNEYMNVNLTCPFTGANFMIRGK